MRQQRPGGRTDDDRGISEVLGAILVFGLVLAVLALIQVSAVPAANQQIEYEHSQRIEADFQQLAESVDRAATDGARRTTPLELGTRYPPRLFLLNPGPVSGDLRTSATQVDVSGFTAQNDETDDYLDGSSASFDSLSVHYRAGYNEYAAAPTISYEGGVLFERNTATGGEDIVTDRGALVSGRRITVLALDGNPSTQQVDELSLDAVPVSAGTRPVSVTAGSDARITVETSLSAETWRTNVLASEYDPAGNRPNAYVRAIECPGVAATDPCNGALVIRFEPGVTYDLRMAKVGLGSGFDEEGARYLTTVAGDDTTIVAGQKQQLAVEVRDRFNNPVSGVDVRFNPASGSGTVAPTTPVTTDEDGRAAVTFTPSSTTGTKTVNATITEGPGTAEQKRVTFGVTVTPPGDGTTEPDRLQDINPRTEDVYLESVSYVDTNVVSATFRNTAGESRHLRTGRLPFVLGTDNPNSVTLSNDGPGGSETYGTLIVARSLEPIGGADGVVVPADGTRTIRFTFDQELEQSATGNFDAFFVFTTEVSDDADTARTPQTFFISDGFGQVPFGAASVGDLPAGSTAATQTFRFTADRDMVAGQTVTVDLDTAQGTTTGQNPQPNPVDYQGATVSSGNAALSATSNGAELTYTVPSGGLSRGDEVVVEVTGVRTQSSPTTVTGIEFSWSGGGETLRTGFDVV